jgi:hypothetical protein
MAWSCAVSVLITRGWLVFHLSWRNAPLPPINFPRQRLALTRGRGREDIRLISTSVVLGDS